MPKRIGQGGTLTVSGNAYDIIDVTAEVSNDLQDVSDTGSGGWVERIAGLSEATITANIFVDAVTPATFAPGASATWTAAAGGGGSVSGTFLVQTATTTNAARTPVQVAVTGASTGSVTLSGS